MHRQRPIATRRHSGVDNITEVDSVIPLRSAAFARDKRSFSISEGTTFGKSNCAQINGGRGSPSVLLHLLHLALCWKLLADSIHRLGLGHGVYCSYLKTYHLSSSPILLPFPLPHSNPLSAIMNRHLYL